MSEPRQNVAPSLQVEVAASTDRGRRRPANEDAFGYSPEDGVFAVCDGMGGAAAGEIASSMAIEHLLDEIHTRRTTQAEPLGDDDPAEWIVRSVERANHAVFHRAQRETRLYGMGTTLVWLLTWGERLWVANVGDSRCYRLRDGQLKLCTLDHSLVEEQVRIGRMTPIEAARSPMRHVITRAIGTQSTVLTDAFELEPQAGDLYLLCSDGLNKELEDKEIERILASADGSLTETCTHLVETANNAGGRDNITCLLLRVL